VLPDGRRNWSFAKGSAENGSGGSAGSGASDLDIRFDDVSIEKGTLIYRDAARGRDERFDDLNLRIVAESLRGPFAAKGSMRAYAIEAAFEATLGRLVEEGATPFNVVVKPADETARLQVSGAISTHPGTIAVHGRLKGESENLTRLLEGVTGGGSWPSALAQPVSIQGEVSVDQRLATVSDLSLELGGFRFAGDVASLLQPPYDARVTLNATQLDLDQLLAAETSGAGEDGEAAAAAPDGQEAERVWVLPADANGRLELSVEALIYRGQLIRQLRVDAALGEGLPGSSDVSLTGSFGEADGQAQFDGHLEAASDNLRGLLQWAGADVGAVPTDRLRRMSLSGRVTGSPRQIAISDFDLRVDLSRLSGGLVIAPRKRPGLGDRGDRWGAGRRDGGGRRRRARRARGARPLRRQLQSARGLGSATRGVWTRSRASRRSMADWSSPSASRFVWRRCSDSNPKRWRRCRQFPARAKSPAGSKTSRSTHESPGPADASS
jgi:hypothetical protein